MSEAALALVEPLSVEKPSALIQRATDVAAVCRAAVLEASVDIDGQRFVEVEGWETIAAAYGCTASIHEVAEEDRGIRAVAELKRADGMVISRAEGFCGLDEPKWSNRPLHARRGMAQTRAISRVCRGVFAFVIVLMKAGLRTTPAEEMPGYGGGSSAAHTVVDSPPFGSSGPAPERSAATRVRFGRSKGKYLDEIDAKDLEWQLAAARKSVDANDPKWGEANKQWLASVEAEANRRGA